MEKGKLGNFLNCTALNGNKYCKLPDNDDFCWLLPLKDWHWAAVMLKLRCLQLCHQRRSGHTIRSATPTKGSAQHRRYTVAWSEFRSCMCRTTDDFRRCTTAMWRISRSTVSTQGRTTCRVLSDLTCSWRACRLRIFVGWLAGVLIIYAFSTVPFKFGATSDGAPFELLNCPLLCASSAISTTTRTILVHEGVTWLSGLNMQTDSSRRTPLNRAVIAFALAYSCALLTDIGTLIARRIFEDVGKRLTEIKTTEQTAWGEGLRFLFIMLSSHLMRPLEKVFELAETLE